MFWAFEKSIFQLFASFYETKLKPFSGKVGQSVQNYLNQKFVIGSFLEKSVEAILSSKNECSERLKREFFGFLLVFLVFEWRSWNNFLVKFGEAFKAMELQFGSRKLPTNSF